MIDQKTWDVVIVGGGPGGLSAGLVLGRSRRKVIIVDGDQPRNIVTREAHGFLTRDGTPPMELRRIAKGQLAKYENVTVMADVVEDVEKEAGRFKTTTRGGQLLYSKKILFATGVKDELPAIPGFKEVYGTSVFLCPYCDGWEWRDEPLALFGNGDGIFPFTKLVYQWSRALMVFTNGPATIDESEKKELAQRNIPLIESPIAKLQSTDGFLEAIVLDSGESIHRRGGFIELNESQACNIPEKLGVPQHEKGGYKTNQHGQTDIDGLAIIGDAKNNFTGLICAAGEGYEIGTVINHELVEEEWKRL
ncbi:NAD(P)/FAD-dependent oxidoreductase [Salinithrix halophila]|uniref:NAD(P)/FAD-dependent oxidoreductase n=1 Tax=Salinithrix halophila TaxID=1485204 RepID=A0ABV8JIY6_9BACL